MSAGKRLTIPSSWRRPHTEEDTFLAIQHPDGCIAVLPPDINKSSLKFAPEFVANPDADAETQDPSVPNSIRYGLSAIKNVGEIAVQNIIEVRGKTGKFESLADFCDRIDTRVVNRKVIECLVKCGAFDAINSSRGQVFADIDYQLNRAAKI